MESVSPDLTEAATAMNVRSTDGQNHLRQKRARSQLSCTPCRQGKLKCNRQHDPACDQCIKRSRESACVFLPPPTKHRPAQNVKGRIRQLESLVVDLMNQNRSAQAQPDAKTDRSRSTTASTLPSLHDQPTPPSDGDGDGTMGAHLGAERAPPADDTPDDIDGTTAPFGRLKISKDEISYVGESHWGAILSSISDLKRDIGEEDEEESVDETSGPALDPWAAQAPVPQASSAASHPVAGLGFMMGDATNVTKEQLISSMPEKKVADRLLSLWFNSPDPFKPCIHAPTFQDEYRRFWKDPKNTPLMWIGLLYAILSLAVSFGLRDLDPASPQAQAILNDVNKYHSLAASAAVLADFTKPKQYTLECLVLYAAGLRGENAFFNVWLMIGLVVRLALRMGYHRDAGHYPSISAFHGEMRRRVWAIVSMIDVLISFQIGLPSIIKTVHSDTQPPRNLLDRDFSISTKVLPPSRSINELTPSSYTRAKLRYVHIFADAADFGHATVVPGPEESIRLARELEEAKASVPPLLQMPDISEVVTDPAEQLMCRFNLDLLYLKTKIVLHRRFMLTPFHQLTPEEQKVGVGTSRKTCTGAALRVLQHHHTIYTATQTGGQLESVKWYMGSISTHDFLLAAMVICLELNTQINDVMFRTKPDGLPCPRRKGMMDALEKSQEIWSNASGRKKKSAQLVGGDDVASKGEYMFDETERASRAMAVMLERVKAQIGGQTPSSTSDPPTAMLQAYADPSLPFPENSGTDTTSDPFHGAISTYQWSNMDGVPADIGSGEQVFFANSGGTCGQPMQNQFVSFADTGTDNSQSAPNDPSPNQGISSQLDYSMIGNMLDVTANLDWDMWDNQITRDTPLPGWTDDLNENMRMPSSGPFRPGNAIVLNGTGPTASNYSGVDFNLSMTEDIDIGDMGFHSDPLWGARGAPPT